MFYKTIQLSATVFTRLDPDDYEWAKLHRWHRNSEGYAVCFDGDQIHYLHRTVIDAETGQIVDHINGDRLDNRRSNLRIVNRQTNAYNRQVRPNTASGYKGVTATNSPDRWRARIYRGGQGYNLGTHPTPEEAARAYNYAAQRLFGDHARLNPVAGDPDGETCAWIAETLAGNPRPRYTRHHTPKRRSDYRGVSWERGWWRVRITHKGLVLHLGYYESEVEAARRYDAKARELHGEMARLNFPGD